MTYYKDKIRRQLTIGGVWSEPNDEENVQGLERLIGENPSDRELIDACKELLFDSDIVVRSGMVSILSMLSKEIGAQWLFNRLQRYISLFKDIEAVGVMIQHPTLEKEYIAAMASAAQSTDSGIIAYLRDVVYDKDWGEWVLLDLVRIDSEWVIEHAKDIIPYDLPSVLIDLTHEQRQRLLEVLAPWPEEELQDIPSAFWTNFSPVEIQDIQQWMKG